MELAAEEGGPLQSHSAGKSPLPLSEHPSDNQEQERRPRGKSFSFLLLFPCPSPCFTGGQRCVDSPVIIIPFSSFRRIPSVKKQSHTSDITPEDVRRVHSTQTLGSLPDLFSPSPQLQTSSHTHTKKNQNDYIGH